MHQEVMDWLVAIKLLHPHVFSCPAVLECGSYIVNGSPRGLFACREYVGLDWRPGPGVDVVGLVHQYRAPFRYDTVISTEMLEHDPHWYDSLQRMITCLVPGGSLVVTCAAPGRGQHELGCAPEPGYYQELAAAQLLDVVGAQFRQVEVVQRWVQSCDTYLLGLGKV